MIDKLKKDVLNYLPANIIPMIIGILSMYIYTNYINPNDFGTYNIIISNVSIIVMLLYEWMAHGVMRYYEAYEREDKGYIIVDTLLILIGSVSSLLIIISIITKNIISSSYIISIYLILTEGLLLILNSIIRSKLKSKIYLLISLIKSVGYFIISIVLLFIYKGNINALLMSKVIINIVIIGIIILKNNRNIKLFKASYGEIISCFIKMVRYGWPIIFTGFMSKCLQVSDRYFIDYYYGKVAVANYTSNYMINDNILGVLFNPIMMSTHNILIRLYEQKDKSGVQVILKKVKEHIIFLFLPIIIFISLFYRNVSLIFISDFYVNSSYILPIVIFGTFFYNYSMYNYKKWELEGKTYKITMAISVSFIVNILLNTILIKSMGILGAAISTLMSYFIFYLISLICVGKNTKLYKTNNLGKYKYIILPSVCWIIIKILMINIDIDKYIINFIFTSISSSIIYLLYIYICFKKKLILNFD